MNKDNNVIKIADIIDSQIPDFIHSENPNFIEFLKQYYYSQEFKGGNIDLSENLIDYKNTESFDSSNLIEYTELNSDVDYFNDVINVNSTHGWPNQYGLLKIDNEIITYTGITTNSFTGCIRGFSGTSSLRSENDPEFLVFEETSSDFHSQPALVYNLSNLFLQEFFKKNKYQFTPGFEELNFDSKINKQNFISHVKDFYKSKGSDNAFNILFKVLYDKTISIVKPKEFCFTTSDDQWVSSQAFFVELVSGNPKLINEQLLTQDKFGNILPATGPIYSIDKLDLKENNLYKINIFSGYSNNRNPSNSIFGEFVPTSKTYAVTEIYQGDSVITVDSSIGFPNNGKLEIGNLVITYSNKTNNQFLNCVGITTNITVGSEVYSENCVYAYEAGTTNKVKFRILNTISNLTDSDAVYSLPGDSVKVENLGNTEETVFTKSLVYNLPLTIFTGKVVEEFSESIIEGINYTSNQVITKFDHRLHENDNIDLYDHNTGKFLKRYKASFNGLPRQFNLSASTLDLSTVKSDTKFRRVLKNAVSDTYPEINNYVSDIQNSFEDDIFYYINSNGFPSFTINPYKRKYQVTVDSNYETLSTSSDHNFDNGDLVTITSFTVIGTFNNKIGISTGVSLYANKVANNQLRLAYSQENIEQSKFIKFSELVNPPLDNRVSGYISSLQLVDSDISRNDSKLDSSKIFKKIPKIPYFSKSRQTTSDGPVAILTNGIEVQNYKASDNIFYGKIESIGISDQGKDYNLKNPPKFYVNKGIDTTTVLIPQLLGKLKEIKVLESGYDYVETPFVKVIGGGIVEANTEVRMKLNYKEISFDSSVTGGIINLIDNSFNLNYSHKFLTGDSVIYRSGKSNKIQTESGQYLSNDSTYYVINVGAGTSFKLAYSKNDSLSGKEVPLSSYGNGYHSFTSTIGKYCIDSVLPTEDIIFRNKKLPFNSTEINSFDNIFIKENHGFVENDEILYSTISGSALSGININNYYYIHKLDNNKFKLKSTKDSVTFVDFGNSNADSYHAIALSPIRITIKGKLTTSGISENGYNATLEPVVLGSVNEVLIARTNINYGYAGNQNLNILNYSKTPKIEVISGKNAYIVPIISNGKIDYISIKNSGSGYFNEIELKVTGIGTGAVLHPIITNGIITSVSIVNSGIGYDNNTRIEVKEKGAGLNLYANIQKWKVNDVLRLGTNNCQSGILLGKKYSLSGNIFRVHFITTDLIEYYNIPILNNNEIPTKHSQLIGWSYDGCPIYGPDGYSLPTKISSIKRLKSSYIKNPISQISSFDIVEDYEYVDKLGDLDEHNGRFCITPEYPDGVYAYFATMENNGNPIFPYIIGNSYKFTPPSENFDLDYNQDQNINNFDIVKHTSPYRVDDKDHYYDYFQLYSKNNIDDIQIQESSKGSIDDVEIVDGGSQYKIGEVVNFDNSYNDGFGAIAKISEISGVGVSSITSNYLKFDNVTLISENNYTVGIVSTYHGFNDNAYINISNSSTDSANYLEGFKEIKVDDYSSRLSQVLQSSTITGLTTSIKVVGSIIKFEVDSYIKIKNSEISKVIGLDYINNSLTIVRPSGSVECAIGSLVQLLPNQFKIYDTNSTGFKTKNSSYYFTPNNSVSLGTSILVGVGNTLNIPVHNGIDYNNYVETGGIYLPNHKFKSGDKLIYSYEGATPIVTNLGNLNSLPNIYVIELQADVIGLVTEINFISDKSNRILFTSASSNQLHKFKTDLDVVTVSASSNNVTVNTTDPHNLLVGDEISLSVISGITTTLNVTYDSNTAKLKLNSINNPEIELFKNNIINFNLSSNSLLNSTFKIYTDENFVNEYVSNNLTKSEDGLTLTLVSEEATPDILYYNLDSPSLKLYSDESVSNFNTIRLKNSYYNGAGKIVSKSNNSFTVNYKSIVETSSYNKTQAILSYKVTKTNSSGTIAKINLISKGTNYNKLPSIKNITSSGFGAKLIPNSTTIGKIKNSSIINKEFILPSDKTLKPYTNLYSTLILVQNFEVKAINILDGGSNYLNPPIVKLYNSKTNELISNFSALATLKNLSVNNIEIIDSANGIEYDQNKIVFTNNSNGLKIINVGIAGTEITLTVETPSSGFDITNPLPFSTGDNIFVENVTTIFGNGINSQDYNYDYFKIISVNQSLGNVDAATIKYYVKTAPGVIDIDERSSVINEKYLPKVELIVEKNSFYAGEYISNSNILNTPDNYPILDIVNIKDSSDLIDNQIITGKSSNAKAKIYKIKKYKSDINTSSGYSNNLGWKRKKGNLSESMQKLQDNDYYQNFSYSIKSSHQVDEWNSAVSELSHISGFKKFSDLVIESLPAGISSATTTAESVVNLSLESYIDENSHFDYDLVSENVDDHPTFSNIIKFKTKKLSSYLLSKENRVLSIDDISGLFNTKNPITITIPIDQIIFSEGLVVKYIFLLQSSDTFFGDFVYPSLFELFLTRNSNIINLTSYAYDPDYTFGTITATANLVDNSVVDVTFNPTEPLRSYSIRAIRETVPSNVGIITTQYGYVRNVQITQYYPGEVVPTKKTIYSIPISDVGSGSLFVGISSSIYSIESYKESSFLIKNQNVLTNVYTENTLNNLGEVVIETSGNNLLFNYTGISGIGVTVYTNIHILTNIINSPSEIVDSFTRLNSSIINYTGAASVAIATVPSSYGGSKYVIELTKNNGISTERGLIQIDTLHYEESYLSNVNYSIIGNFDDLNFQTVYDDINDKYIITYVPNESANYTIKFFEKNISKLIT